MTNEELESLAKEIQDMRDDFYTRLIGDPNARQWAIASLEDAARLVRSKMVKKRIRRTVWLNIFDEGVGAFEIKHAADTFGYRPRLACLKIEVDCEQGEGL